MAPRAFNVVCLCRLKCAAIKRRWKDINIVYFHVLKTITINKTSCPVGILFSSLWIVAAWCVKFAKEA